MGYSNKEEFKAVVVDRMRNEVDPDKDWDSLIHARSTPPSWRKESGEVDTENANRPRRRRLWSGGIPSKADTDPQPVSKHTNATQPMRARPC